jgi:hypothetical protein
MVLSVIAQLLSSKNAHYGLPASSYLPSQPSQASDIVQGALG